MRKRTELHKQKRKTLKTSKNKFEKSGSIDTSFEPNDTSEFGGLPFQNLKKNLGCGG
jgi:hypothetical protein